MKISCQSCAAKYTIADEKVVGKVIKLKCKKCSSTIVVNGNDPGVVASLQRGEADDAATQLMSQQHADLGGGANPDEWTVSVTDDDQRTMTTAQILTEYAKGALNQDTYVWRDGMADWSPLLEVPELAQLLQQASQEATAVAPAPAAAHHNGNGHGYAPMAAAAAPMAAAAATASTPSPGVSAARRAGAKGGGVDLFGGGGLQHETARSAPAPTSPSDKHIGERNETSVLFSLKDLAAAEAGAARAPAKKDPFEAHKNDRVDDILSLGGVGAAPMLAPPPLMAPIIEPPPPPPPPPSVHPPASGMMMAQAQFAPPPKASPIPFIVGGVGVLALLGGIIFFVVAGGSDKDKTEAKTATTQESKPAETSKPADTSTEETAKPSDTGEAPSSEPMASASAEPTADPASTSPHSSKLASNDPKKDDPKKDDPKKDEPKKDEPKKDDPPAAGGDAPFDRGAASAALGAAAGSAKGCKKADGPTGSTKVQVTFAPSGKATQAVVGAPFAGTSVGSCIASTFKGARVPPFSGGAMTVSKTVNIK